MKKTFHILKLLCLQSFFCILSVNAFGAVGQDTFAIHNLGHGSLYFEYKNLIIHVDPYSSQDDYSLLPDANVILITHGHSDHYDLAAINLIKTDTTVMIAPQAVINLGTYTGLSYVMNNGDSIGVKGLSVKAVPAYNVVNTTYHPKGVGNGYILTFGEKRIYIAGDTENIPEMSTFGKIDIAFLPMNLPFTMSVPMATDAAKKVRPDILYIYHFGSSDTAALRTSLNGEGMKIRIGESLYYESDKRTVTKISGFNAAKNYTYPNPVRDYLIIDNINSRSTIYLYDLAGHLLLKKQLLPEGENRINVKSLRSGTYVVKFQDKGKLHSELIIKQ